jgi:CDP-glucose 4,6-dehydratase
VSRPDPRFWSGKRVLLTGHTGFKGSWAAIWLVDMGAQVAGLALAPDQTPALYDLASVGDLARPSIVIDLRNREALDALPDSFDIVLHMAAQPIVRASIEDPINTFATNVLGTVHLLEALRSQPNLRAILAITSDKVYANAEAGRAFTEADALGGKDPYSASKAAAEIVIQSYARSFFDRLGIPLATARGGNVIGGGDFSRDRLVADLVRAARAGEIAVLRHPEATRPWQHVLDCVAGYLIYLERLATNPEAPRALNFGPRPGGREVSVGELATRANAALGAKPWRHEPDPQSLEATTLGIDASLAKSFLNFESRLDARAAVDWTVEWYGRQARGENALALCREQIARYEGL